MEIREGKLWMAAIDLAIAEAVAENDRDAEIFLSLWWVELFEGIHGL